MGNGCSQGIMEVGIFWIGNDVVSSGNDLVVERGLFESCAGDSDSFVNCLETGSNMQSRKLKLVDWSISTVELG